MMELPLDASRASPQGATADYSPASGAGLRARPQEILCGLFQGERWKS